MAKTDRPHMPLWVKAVALYDVLLKKYGPITEFIDDLLANAHPSPERRAKPLRPLIDKGLRLLDLDPVNVEWDHDPALELRERGNFRDPDNPDKTIAYWPPPNDPTYIVPRSKDDHSRKTNGPGGEKRITSRGGDHGDAAHLRAVTRKEAEFRARLLAKYGVPEGFTAIEPTTFDKRKIASRGFDKRKRPSRG